MDEQQVYEPVIILCMKWGEKYGPEYVNRLYNMVYRHLNYSFQMYCFTDNSQGIRGEIYCQPMPELNLPLDCPERGWNKLSLFEGLDALQGRHALFLDLDVVIVDNIDCFFQRTGDFFIIHDWKRPWRLTGNSSVYRFKIGAFPTLMPYFRANFTQIRCHFRNEQAFLSWFIDQQQSLQYWDTHWCRSYKYHCLHKIPWAFFSPPHIPLGAKIIVFHGEINPPDAIRGGGGKWYRYVLPSQWIKDAWQ